MTHQSQHPHSPLARPSRRALARAGDRRGSALLLVLMITVALAALAMSAIFLTSNAGILSRFYDKERDFRYAAEAAIAMGKSRLTSDTTVVLPDSGYVTLMTNQPIQTADGQMVRGVTANLYAGRTGNFTGQFGKYASLVAEARDSSGARFVRRLELTEENFAKFLDWSDQTVGGCYAKGEYMYGPVWSNASISVCNGSYAGAEFRDEVGTAGSIVNKSSGVFTKTPKENQRAMVLPSMARLSSLPAYASGGNLSFVQSAIPNLGTGTTAAQARARLEFQWVDLNASNGTPNQAIDDDEGFVRVFVIYQNISPKALRAEFDTTVDQSGAAITATQPATAGATSVKLPQWQRSIAGKQCGDWHYTDGSGPAKFFPVAVHNQDWVKSALDNSSGSGGGARSRNGFTSTNPADAHAGQNMTATARQILSQPGARCYPAGDPHLVAVARPAGYNYTPVDPATGSAYVTTAIQKGGEDSTFTPASNTGRWLTWSGTVPATIPTTGQNLRNDRLYLFPLYRGFNAGFKGVIYLDAPVALSGTLRGRVTVYSTKTVTFIDDLTYSVRPFSTTPVSKDMLGVIAGLDVTIADNGINTPQRPDNGPAFVWLDDNSDFVLDGVVMALNKSFFPENYSTSGPGWWAGNGSNCQSGRGCLKQFGGAIVKYREATVSGTTGQGMLEQREYDHRMSTDSPPYFPTTGRYLDNRYFEIDPVGFNVTELFRRLTPGQ